MFLIKLWGQSEQEHIKISLFISKHKIVYNNNKDKNRSFETFKVKMGRVQEWWLVTRSKVKGLCVRNFQETEIAQTSSSCVAHAHP